MPSRFKPIRRCETINRTVHSAWRHDQRCAANVGRCLVNLGEYEKAIEVLTPVIEAWPDDIETNVVFAAAYTALGDDAKAEKHDQASKKALVRTDTIERDVRGLTENREMAIVLPIRACSSRLHIEGRRTVIPGQGY